MRGPDNCSINIHLNRFYICLVIQFKKHSVRVRSTVIWLGVIFASGPIFHLAYNPRMYACTTITVYRKQNHPSSPGKVFLIIILFFWRYPSARCKIRLQPRLHLCNHVAHVEQLLFPFPSAFSFPAQECSNYCSHRKYTGAVQSTITTTCPFIQMYVCVVQIPNTRQHDRVK